MKDGHPVEEPIGERPPVVAAPPCVMVVFGAGGDLTRRKLVPALINLRRGGLLTDATRVVAVVRPECRGERVPRQAPRRRQRLPRAAALGRRARLARLASLPGLAATSTIRRRTRAWGRSSIASPLGNALFYLAVPPALFGQIAKGLGGAGLAQGTVPGSSEPAWRRIIVEKPFGHDVASARALNQELASAFGEPQIYRIDHYLGKETVQNLMVFRFANGIFEPVWNRRYIDHVQITVAETVGVEGRGGYYETAGALRDMVQNHLFQLLALTAMEPPNSFEADRVRDERVKVLRAIRPFTPELVAEDVVRGQYVAGAIDGKPVVGYREEPTVRPRPTPRPTSR